MYIYVSIEKYIKQTMSDAIKSTVSCYIKNRLYKYCSAGL